MHHLTSATKGTCRWCECHLPSASYHLLRQFLMYDGVRLYPKKQWEASKTGSKEADDQWVTPLSSCIPKTGHCNFDPKRKFSESLPFLPEPRSCSNSILLPWLGYIYRVLLYGGFFFPLPFKKKDKREENTATLTFFLRHLCTLQEAHAAEPDLWADALHHLYREQVQGEELQKVRDWRENRQTKNNARGKRWREKQKRTDVNRDNIMKEKKKE